jgi:hypothetical protein
LKAIKQCCVGIRPLRAHITDTLRHSESLLSVWLAKLL